MEVILVAHGPRAVTKLTVGRLMRMDLVDRVFVVRASDRVRNVVFPSSAVVAVDEVGTPGVTGVARSLGDSPVLLMHDDVAVSRTSVETMLSLLDDDVDFVAPHTNERTPDQFVGPLPRIADLDRFPRVETGPARRIGQARHACIVGRASSIVDLGGSLVIPGSSLTRSSAKILLAPAVAAHDLSCNAQLLPDDGSEILVASMIVRDEEQSLPAALAAVEGLVDRMEICDTGSVDRTVEVAESLGANVTHIEWRNDFGWARTQALEACRNAPFVLMFDADERIEVDDAVLFRRWLRTWAHEIDAVTVDVINHRGDTRSVSSNRSIRVAKAPLVRFEGAIHEVLRFPEGYEMKSMFHSEMRVMHHGYMAEVISSKDKVARNIAISKSAYEAGSDLKTLVDYARSLRMKDENDPLAEELFREAFESVPSDAPVPSRSYLAAVVAAYEMTAGEVDSAIALSEQALELTPSEDIALATIGAARCGRSEWQLLVDMDERLASMPPGVPMFAIAANLARYQAFVARALVELGRPSEAAARLEGILDHEAVAAVAAFSPALPHLLDHPDSLVAVLASDQTGVLIAQLATMVPPEVTAQTAHAALLAGGDAPDLVVVGLTAALMKAREDLIDDLVGYANLIDGPRRERLAAVARKYGYEAAADRLDLLAFVGAS